MEKEKFEVWQYDGIPYDKPAFTTKKKEDLIKYLSSRVYQCVGTGEIRGENSERVFFKGKEIPLEKLFTNNDFYSKEEWKKIVGD